jgi:hypothetical protein
MEALIRTLTGDARECDWRLNISDRLMLSINPHVLSDVKNKVAATHETLAMWYDNERLVTVYKGWYGPDKKACALAIAPLIEEIDHIRRGYKDDSGRPTLRRF